ncbi:hypothetical protein HID58_034030 [Brassica napus]|uniref:Uncharacterized protein n=1 Tax=Brassica napus TaxID=3708 RepID=A0ABQ8C101_BRANA|nr:hypothetical protein HID58_034030 [Brassica napus]
MISLTTSFWSEKLRKFATFLTLSSIIHHRRCKTSPIIFKIHAAIKLSRMFEKAFTRSFNSLQNIIGVQIKLNIKALAVQSGRGRVIKSEQNIRVLHVNQLCILQCHLVRDHRNLRVKPAALAKLMKKQETKKEIN